MNVRALKRLDARLDRPSHAACGLVDVQRSLAVEGPIVRFLRVILSAACAVSAFAALGAEGGYVDPAQAPARRVSRIETRPMMAVTQTADRLVAVGLRGLVAMSTDGGRTWQQAEVPVETDLVAVQFPSTKKGWAVGHDGVVVSSDDGGQTWRKVLDGRLVAQITREAYERRSQDEPIARFYSREAHRILDSAPDTPFLDVLFLDESEGFIVGNFGTLLHTADGGKSWQPWMDRIANDDALHLTAIRRIGADVYVCGERGHVWRLDPAAQRFVLASTPYTGTLFGMVGQGDVVLAFGLRGTVYRSSDKGRSWTKVESGIDAGIVAAASLPDGPYLLLGQGGELVSSVDGGQSLRRVQLQTGFRPTSVQPLSGGAFVLAAIEGLRRYDGAELRSRPSGRLNDPRLQRMSIEGTMTIAPTAGSIETFDDQSGRPVERLVFNNRVWILGIFVLLTLWLAHAASQLKVNASFEAMMPQSHPFVQNYLKHKAALGGLGNAIRIVIENPKGDIFDPAYLAAVRDVNDKVFLTPGVDRTWQKSLWTPLVRWTQVTEEGLGAVP